MNQDRMPILDALEDFKSQRIVPFDVPGHKRGKGNKELAAFLGEACVSIDVNSMKCLDNLCHPISVIREAEMLAADAFEAQAAFLMVGGTTSAVQAMILATNISIPALISFIAFNMTTIPCFAAVGTAMFAARQVDR